MSDEERNTLHKRLVEDVLCGLDINQHGIQLAACNMTLGAPTVDYERMNLVTMPHGPQSDGSCRAGSLEILTTAENARDLRAMTAPSRSLENLDAAQVSESEEIRFPLRDLDVAIMNAPFTANENRGKKYGAAGRRAMQLHELGIKELVERRDSATTGVINTNSIGTFFSPLADMLVRDKQGTLAKVIPTTACTNTSGVPERRFLAKRFHIETVVTSHDPRRPNFSENTGIHESLLICRRRVKENGNTEQPTRFVSLHTMPSTATEAVEAVDAIQAGDTRKWITVSEQPERQDERGGLATLPISGPGTRSRCDAARRLERAGAYWRPVSPRASWPANPRCVPSHQQWRTRLRPCILGPLEGSSDDHGGRSRNRASLDRKDPRSLPVTGSRQDTLLVAARFNTAIRSSCSRYFQEQSSPWGPCGCRFKPGILSVDEPRRRCVHGTTVRLERARISDEDGAQRSPTRRSRRPRLATLLLVPDFKTNEPDALGRSVSSIQNAYRSNHGGLPPMTKCASASTKPPLSQPGSISKR